MDHLINYQTQQTAVYIKLGIILIFKLGPGHETFKGLTLCVKINSPNKDNNNNNNVVLIRVSKLVINLTTIEQFS